MKKILISSVFLFAFHPIGEAANTSPAFDALLEVSAPGAPAVDVSRMFDGAKPGSAAFSADLPSVTEAVGTINSGKMVLVKPVPVPISGNMPPSLPTKSVLPYALESGENQRIAKGMELLKEIKLGEPLAALASEPGMQILWTRLSALDRVEWAVTLQPIAPKWEKIILLKAEFRNELFDSADINSAVLALVLGHELVHLRDFVAQGHAPMDPGKKNSVYLLAELNAFTTEVLLYSQLKKAGKMPAINTPNESKMIQQQRLHADIYDFINAAGRKPVKSRYDKMDTVNGLPFDDYITQVVDRHKKGIWTFLVAVKWLYGLERVSENPPVPGFIESQTHTGQYTELQQYNQIRGSLTETNKNYLRWAQQHLSLYQEPDSDTGSGTGGPDGGTHTHVNGPDFGGGTDLDHPGAGNP